MARLSPLPALALLMGAAAAFAQVPASPEFVVNTYTYQEQRRPALALDDSGNFVVAWQSNFEDGSGYGVFAQRFDAAGIRRGGEFQVSTSTAFHQYLADVAVDPSGDFLVVWSDGGLAQEVSGQLFRSDGQRRGSEFRVNAYGTGRQWNPAVATGRAGNFVVVWMSLGQDGSEEGIYGQRFDAAGREVGSEFRVNTTTTGPQRRPDVTMMADGGFAVVWDGTQGSGNSVFGRVYDPDGAPRGPEFGLSAGPLAQSNADVAAQGSGFVAAWTSYPQDGSHNAVLARRFDGLGAPVGTEFLVNTYTTNSQALPVVAAASSGSFVVAWESFLQDGSLDGVFGQRFDATGARRGAEFQLNAFTGSPQRQVTLASDRVGNFVAAWTSDDGQDGSNAVIGRRFQGLRPEAASVSLEDDGVLEVGDSPFRFVTSWRNVTGAPQTPRGLSSGFVVPSGLSLAFSSVAVYPTVADGGVVACLEPECFNGALSGTRPAGHVDLSFLETIQPDAQGQVQRWVLHVGDSFTDVPRTNLFYRFVETLLHNGVTGGCTATQYCPGSPTTREQMAVFVLVAKEGTGYAPPACAPPNLFADVPETSPFCRWIEELANRAVVSGCGGGNYCPAAAVTREQMAVFVLRTLDPALSPPACTTPMFADVPASSPFCRWIEELARRGVVTGCGGGNYCPADPVTREQMGVFIGATFALSLYGP